MAPRRNAFTVPKRLTVATFTLVGASACSTPPMADVIDVVDTMSADIVSERATPDDASDITVDTTTDVTDDTAMDDACGVMPGGPGYECIADFRADVLAPCPSGRTCTASACPTGCLSCYGGPFAAAGFQCLPDPHADATVTCPSARVCTASDCPTGCSACTESAYCAPIPSADGSVVASCTPQLVCNPADCPPGCEALV